MRAKDVSEGQDIRMTRIAERAVEAGKPNVAAGLISIVENVLGHDVDGGVSMWNAHQAIEKSQRILGIDPEDTLVPEAVTPKPKAAKPKAKASKPKEDF